jgi:hypothetical protein
MSNEIQGHSVGNETGVACGVQLGATEDDAPCGVQFGKEAASDDVVAHSAPEGDDAPCGVQFGVSAAADDDAPCGVQLGAL